MISISNVSHKYGDLSVLDDISLTIRRGEIVSLVGPSGSGKTTLLKIVAGLIQPSAGRSLIDGRLSVQVRRSGQLGYVLQNPVLLPWRNVLENVTLSLELKHADRSQREAAASKLLDRLGLISFAKARPEHLSGGMKQRVAIARAMVSQPEILLMDEPFGALDDLMREQYDIELRELATDLQQTVIFVTHSLTEAVLLSDRVIILGTRPAQIKGIIQIELDPSRRNEIGSTEHIELVQRLRTALRDK